MKKIEIITIADYKEFQPDFILTNVPEEALQSSINLTYIKLNAKCGSMIEKVWDITDKEDPLYRTEEEHDYIRSAMLLQTQYELSYNNDPSNGQTSISGGGISYSETRQRDQDTQILKMVFDLLVKARVYYEQISVETKLSNKNNDDFSNLNPYDSKYETDPLTMSVADLRYIRNYQDPKWEGKVATINNQGIVEWNTPKTINEVSFSDITGQPTDNANLATELTNINTKIDTTAQTLTDQINTKATTGYVDNKVSPKADTSYVVGEINSLNSKINTKANNNEVVKLTGDQEISGNKIFTGEIVRVDKALKIPDPFDFDDAANKRYVDKHTGSTSFANITGQPNDNTNLKTELNKKVNLDGINYFNGINNFNNKVTLNYSGKPILIYFDPISMFVKYILTDEQNSEVTIDKKVGSTTEPYVGDKPNQVSTIKATKLWSSNTEIESGVVAIENFLPGQRVGISNTWTIPTSDPSFAKINTILNNGGHVEFYMNNKTLPNIVVYHSQTNKEEIMNYNIATFEGAVDCVLTLYRHDNAVCTELNLRSGFIGGTIQISNDHPRARLFGMTGYMSVTSGTASISLFGQGNCNAVSSAKNFYNIDFVDNTQLSTRAFPDGQQAPSLFNVPWKGFIGK